MKKVNWQVSLYNLEKEILRNIPKYKSINKKDSFLMKLISWILFFNRGFMERFITTIGTTVYWPNNAETIYTDEARFEILAHEYVHMLDSKKDRLFSLKYLFPQILAVFSLFSIFAVFSTWFLLFLAFLLCLLPWAAKYRTLYEMRGYSMSIYVSGQLTQNDFGSLTRYVALLVKNNFCGWNYYKMCWNEKWIVKRMTDILLKNDAICVELNDLYHDVKECLAYNE